MMPDLFVQSPASFELASLEVEEATVLATLCSNATTSRGHAALHGHCPEK